MRLILLSSLHLFTSKVNYVRELKQDESRNYEAYFNKDHSGWLKSLMHSSNTYLECKTRNEAPSVNIRHVENYSGNNIKVTLLKLLRSPS